MSIQELGSVGEVVAAIATLVTLAYLAFQIRQNTKVARAELTKDLFLTSRSALFEIAANEDLARINAEVMGRTDVEAHRKYMLVNSFFRLYELYFNLASQGLLDPAIGDSYERVMRLFVRVDTFAAWWEEARQLEYQGDFAAHVDSILAEFRGVS